MSAGSIRLAASTKVKHPSRALRIWHASSPHKNRKSDGMPVFSLRPKFRQDHIPPNLPGSYSLQAFSYSRALAYLRLEPPLSVTREDEGVVCLVSCLDAAPAICKARCAN